MTDRPSELDLSLDAVDEAFKSMIGQFTKDRAEGAQIDIVGGVRKAMVARKAMIATVASVIAK